MSTRAVYTFKSQKGQPADTHHIYKHCDGYPSGAADAIASAAPLAWNLPRFESSEFAAAFVAGNKESGGGVYLTRGFKYHGDLEYRYEITAKGNDICVTAFAVDHSDGWDKPATYRQIFDGTLQDFKTFAESRSED